MPAPPHSPPPVRVLLADDSPSDRALTSLLLEEVEGLRVDVHVATGYQDLRDQRGAGPFDVYLLDYRLGDGSGLDGAREILADEKDAVVILLTGMSDPEVDREAEEAGVTDFLRKNKLDADGLGRSLRYALRRQKDRRALRASEATYRQLVRALPDTAVYVLDRDLRLRIAEGHDQDDARRDELEGRHVEDLLGDTDHPEFIEHVRAALAGEQRSIEHDRDGRHLLSRFLPLRGDDGGVEAGMVVTLDLTRQTKARLALEEAQTIAGLGSWEWDARADVVTWSTELYRLFDVDPAKEDGRTFTGYLARVHPDDRARAQEVIETAVRTGEGYAFEHRVIRGDGEIRTILGRGEVLLDEDGTVRGLRGVGQDVTDARRAAARVQEAEERFRSAFDEAPIGMALATLDGRHVQVNPALGDITGRRPEELLELSIRDLTHPDDRADDAEGMRRLIAGEDVTLTSEKRMLHADGYPVWVAVHATAVRSAAGAPQHLLLQVQDITERRRFEDQLQHMADHDPLTGLPNRRSFQRELEAQVGRNRRYGGNSALLVIDLDQFKAINDTLGHSAGDELVVEVAARLRERLRASDVLARLGGDEFAVLLPEADMAAAERVAAALLGALRRAQVPGGGSRSVTGSIGVVLVDGSARSAEDLLVNADLAMYDAKEEGRDRYSTYSSAEAAQPRIKARLTWLERVVDALENERFVLFAQPILDINGGQVIQHELLVRMKTADGDIVPPATFLDVAERFDLVQRIDRLVMREAVGLIAQHAGEGRDLALSVNLSGRTLGDGRFLRALESELAEHEIDPALLSFELTETAAVANIHLARRFTERLHELGCRFALDDFGAGFGSFYYLKHLPFDYVKIDGEFVRNCISSLADQLVIKSVVDIAQGLGKQTVAEFTEDERTLEFLRRHGVDFAQGYHIGRPAPVAEALPVWTPLSGPVVGAGRARRPGAA